MSLATFRVLLANCEPSITVSLKMLVGSACESKVSPEFTVADRADALLELTRSQSFDFCIVVLNNVLGDPRNPKSRFDQTLDAIRLLKSEHHIPLLVSTGYEPRASIHQQVFGAGADWVTDLPVVRAELNEAVAASLNRKLTNSPSSGQVMMGPLCVPSVKRG